MNYLENLDWNGIVEQLSEAATSERVRVQLRKTGPLLNKQEITLRFSQTEEMLQILHTGVRPSMESLDFYSPWSERLKRSATLNLLELKDVRKFCAEALALKNSLENYKSKWILSLSEVFPDTEPPLSTLDHLMTAEGEIRSDASETLSRLLRDKNELEKQIRTQLDRLVKSHSMENVLQDRYVTNREGRWVLPVKSGMQHQLGGIIHDVSQTKQTVFMEPQEVVQQNNSLRQINSSIEEEIQRLLIQTSRYLQSQLTNFQTAFTLMEDCDARLSQAHLALKTQAHPCEISDAELELIGVRHPLLVIQKGLEKIVPNDLHLSNDKKTMILSGPNAGGKTVLLKSIGLACHMARCGLLVSCEPNSRIPLFESVISIIGDAQRVESDLSTFAGHLKLLSQADQAAGPRTLLLIDEICGATDPEEGSALACAFVEAYATKGAFSLITSHLAPLKKNWNERFQLMQASLEFREDQGVPTYRLLTGVIGRSFALRTAKRVGIREDLLERATTFLSPERKELEIQMDELENYKQSLLKAQEDLEIQKKSVEDQKAKYFKLIDQFRAERDLWLKKSLQKSEQRVEDYFQSLKEERKNKSPIEVKMELPEIVRGTRTQKIESAEEFAQKFPPGSKIFIPSLNQEGIIQGTPNSKGQLPILAQSMRLFLPWEQLMPPRSFDNPTQKILRKSGVTTSFSNEEKTLDLRGLRVEEALAKIDRELDAAMMSKQGRLQIIHGHGTDSLKKSIRASLSRSPYVRTWKAGDDLTGGDGVTWVELDI